MAHVAGNLFESIPSALAEEQCDVLAEGRRWSVSRIVSTGQASPPGFWYDQDAFEWVAVLQGEAELRFEGDDDTVTLSAGDWLSIPAHRRHRLEWTRPDEPTIWLAVFVERELPEATESARF